MTDDEIKQARALCDMATPGPWHTEKDEFSTGCDHVTGIFASDGGEIVKTDSGMYPPTIADAAFIAGARMLLPKALDEIERLRRAWKTLEGPCEAHCATKQPGAHEGGGAPCTCRPAEMRRAARKLLDGAV